jgi:hypothetical protein
MGELQRMEAKQADLYNMMSENKAKIDRVAS